MVLQEDKLSEKLEHKTVMVTGGTGCIGSILIRELIKYEPVGIISISRGITIPGQVIDGVNYLHTDLRSEGAAEGVLTRTKPDVIYHLAAQRDPSLAESEVNRTLITNISGTKNILSAARKIGVSQVVYASTGKAMRPFTADTYAASKKAGEWLMADAAVKTDMECSGARFTHVVDNSTIFRRIQQWVDEDTMIRLHGANLLFYVQSARESAHLLLNASLDTQPGVLRLGTIRDLGWPVNLTDIILGYLRKRDSNTPLYITGYEQGYEEIPYPALYDPQYSGELSPLINAFEAPQAQISPSCPEIDSFPLEIKSTPELMGDLNELEMACLQNQSEERLSVLRDNLSWKILDARLAKISHNILERSIHRMLRYPHYSNLPEEHIKTLEAVQQAISTFGE